MRKIPVTQELRDMLEQQRVAFREKFGREPGAGDPIFFDPNADQPSPFDEDQFHQLMLEGFLLAQMPHHLIYAFLKSGILLTEVNKQYVEPDALEAWNQAIDEYAVMTSDRP